MQDENELLRESTEEQKKKIENLEKKVQNLSKKNKDELRLDERLIAIEKRLEEDGKEVTDQTRPMPIVGIDDIERIEKQIKTIDEEQLLMDDIVSKNKEKISKIHVNIEKHIEKAAKSNITFLDKKIVTLTEQLNEQFKDFEKQVERITKSDINFLDKKITSLTVEVEEHLIDLEQIIEQKTNKVISDKVSTGIFNDHMHEHVTQEIQKLKREYDLKLVSEEHNHITDQYDSIVQRKKEISGEMVTACTSKENERRNTWGYDDEEVGESTHQETDNRQSNIQDEMGDEFEEENYERVQNIPVLEHLIIGDSIIQGIDEELFHKKKETKVVSLRGKGINEVTTFLEKVIKKKDPQNIIIHTGSNDLCNKDTPQSLKNKFENLIAQVKQKFPESNIVISMIINRQGNSTFNTKATQTNNLLKNLCNKNGIDYVFHQQINDDQYQYRYDKIHLSKKGTSTFVYNLKQILRKQNDDNAQSKRNNRDDFFGSGKYRQNNNATSTLKNILQSLIDIM